jgi:hypothetical protein
MKKRPGGGNQPGSSDGAARLLETRQPVKCSRVLHFLQQPNFARFRAAFPWSVEEPSFSDWLELNNDSLPESQSFSEWLATTDDAISPAGPSEPGNKNLNSNTTMKTKQNPHNGGINNGCGHVIAPQDGDKP